MTNLAWKLDVTLRGRGSEQLLDSYSEERLPVITDVIETTDRLTKVMGTPNMLAQVLRDSLIPVVSHLSTFQHAFVNRLSGLGIAYDKSPIVEGRGERVFEEFMRDDQIPSRYFALLLPDETSQAARDSVESLAAGFSPILTVRASQHEAIRLIRPDGYLAFSAPSHSGERSIATARSLLLRMTNQTSTGARG